MLLPATVATPSVVPPLLLPLPPLLLPLLLLLLLLLHVLKA